MADFRGLIANRSVNAAVSWMATGVLVLVALASLVEGIWLWTVFALLVAGVVVLPPLLARDGRATLPGELVALVALPAVVRTSGHLLEVTPFVTMAGLALLVLLVLDEFTSLEMVPRFAVAFVVITTMAFAAVWAMATFAADALLGTDYVAGQRALNLNLLAATVVGLLAGVGFEAYFRETDGAAPLDGRPIASVFGTRSSPEADRTDADEDSTADSTSERPTDDAGREPDAAASTDGETVQESTTIRTAIRGLQLVLVVVVGYSIATVHGSLFVNSAVPLALTFLPAITRRRYGYPMHAPLALLISVAATLHAVGSLGPYQQTNWYDTVTHALSSTLVAGVGYAIAHGLELHTDRVSFSPRFRGVFVVLFVLAIGVVWELLEFGSGLAANYFGGGVLAQYGVGDIVKDLAFNAVGAILVALWGTQLFRRPAGVLTEEVGGLFR